MVNCIRSLPTFWCPRYWGRKTG